MDPADLQLCSGPMNSSCLPAVLLVNPHCLLLPLGFPNGGLEGGASIPMAAGRQQGFEPLCLLTAPCPKWPGG